MGICGLRLGVLLPLGGLGRSAPNRWLISTPASSGEVMFIALVMPPGFPRGKSLVSVTPVRLLFRAIICLSVFAAYATLVKSWEQPPSAKKMAAPSPAWPRSRNGRAKESETHPLLRLKQRPEESNRSGVRSLYQAPNLFRSVCCR